MCKSKGHSQDRQNINYTCADGLEQNYQEYELPEPNYSDDDEWDSIPCIDYVRILRMPVQMQNYQEYELPEPNYSDDDNWDSIPYIDHVRILRMPVQMQVLSHTVQEVHPEKSLLMAEIAYTTKAHTHLKEAENVHRYCCRCQCNASKCIQNCLPRSTSEELEVYEYDT